jgi:hypothetical protein
MHQAMARQAVWVALVCGGMVAYAPAPAQAAHPSGSSSRELRDEAARAIPFAKLDRNARAKVSQVLSTTTLYRRLPAQMIECDPNLYVFLVEHPDLVVNIWEVLGISEVVVKRLGEQTFSANDKAGTIGRMEFLHCSPDLHLLYAEGSYDGPLFGRSIKGNTVLMLRNRYFRNADGRIYVRCQLDAFMHVENVGVGVLAKTFQPLVGAAADHNFSETAAFLASVSRAAEVNHAGMQRMATRLNGVEAADRERFAALTEQLAVRAALLQTAQNEAQSGGTALPASRGPSLTTRRDEPDALER